MRPPGVIRALPVPYADDVRLVEGLRAGSPHAAAAAWDRFHPLARRLLTRTLGPSDEIDDLLQDVFITLFRRVVDLRDEAALRSFLVGIVLRTARSELRRRRIRRWVTLSPTGMVPELVVPEMDHGSRQALQQLYGILDRLDPDSRLAFVLRNADGLELTEVADALGCSLATVKRKIARATERVMVHARKNDALAAFARFTELEPEAPIEDARTARSSG